MLMCDDPRRGSRRARQVLAPASRCLLGEMGEEVNRRSCRQLAEVVGHSFGQEVASRSRLEARYIQRLVAAVHSLTRLWER
jgi:hypothetical protein